MYSFQALQILMFLIPGLISATIVDVLIVRGKKKEFERIMEALILSMLIYTIYSFVSGTSPVTLNQLETTGTYSFDRGSLLWLTLLSIGISVLVSCFITTDLHMRLARFLRVTTKTARPSVWLDVFHNLKRYIIVEFVDGTRLMGWPSHYSDDPEQQYLFLSEPAWVVEVDGRLKFEKLDKLEGVLITPEKRIKYIQILATQEV